MFDEADGGWFVGAGGRGCASLVASELANDLGARLIEVVDDRNREVQQDIEQPQCGQYWSRDRS